RPYRRRRNAHHRDCPSDRCGHFPSHGHPSAVAPHVRQRREGLIMPQPPANTFAELDEYTDRIPLDVLRAWLLKTEVTLDMVRRFLKFSAEHYVRNLMHSGSSYQALVICWHSGQRSPIHDHRGSSCAVK